MGATLPYNVTLQLPTFTQFSQAGFTIGVGSSTYLAYASTLSTASPSLQFTTYLAFSGSATLGGSANASFFGNSYGGSFGPTTLFNNASNLTLLSFNTAANGSTDGKVQLLPTLFDNFSLGKLFSRAKATGSLIKNVANANNSQEQDKVILDALTFKTGFKTQDLFTSSFQIPNIAMGNATVSNGSLTATGKGEFANLSISLTALLAKVIPQFPPLAAKASLDFVAGEASISVTALNVQVASVLNLTQTDTVIAQGTTVGFNFGQMISVRVLKAGSNTTPAYQTVSSVSGLAPGDKLQFENALAANSSINLTPIYTTSANLQSQFGVSADISIPINVLQGKLAGEILGFSDSTKFGPLYTTNPPIGTIPLGTLFNQTYSLSGFSNVTGGVITLSTQAYEWKTDANGTSNAPNANLFDPNNYSTPGATPPSGQDVDISNADPSNRLVVLDNVDADPDHFIGTLTIEGNAEVDVPASRTLTLAGNLELGVGNTNGLVLANGAILNMTNANGSLIDAGTGNVSMGGLNAKIQTAAGLTFLSGNIVGTGVVQVAGDITMGSSRFLSTLNTLTITGNSLTYESNGGASGRLEASGGSQLIVNSSGGVAGQVGDRIEIQADQNSTITLNVSSVNSAHITSGFGGNGTVELAHDMSISDILNDGAIKTTNNAQLSTGGGVLTNNGSFLITAGSQLSTLFDLELSGSGVLELQGGTLTGVNGSTITNDQGHTLRLSADGASFGTDNTGNGASVINNGVIESTLPGAGTVSLNAASAAGSFINNGEIRGNNSTITLAIGSFDNEDAFEAGLVVMNANGTTTTTTGSLIMTGSTLENLSASGDTLTLDGGLYVLADGNSRMALKGPAATGTNFVNSAGIELLGSSNGKSGLTINGTDLSDMSSFTNDTFGMLVLGPGRSFITNNFINNGSLVLMGNPGGATTFGNVTNNGSILVIPTAANSVANLTLHSVGGVATNNGDIDVDQTSGIGDITLNIQGDANATSFTNAGIVEVHNATLNFNGLSLNHGGGFQFQGGTWIVDSSTLSLTLDFLPAILNANLSMIGGSSKLLFNGGTAFEDAITHIGSDGKLTLDTRDMTFSNPLFNAGIITLANGSTLATPDLINNSVITGFGSLNAPVTNNGLITAFGGQLTLLQDVDNTHGQINALSPDAVNSIGGGGIGLDNNSTITGGIINVQSGGAFWGYGSVESTSITNNGVIQASDFYRSLQPGALVQNQFTLTMDITPASGASLTNNGQIIADADQTLAIISQSAGAPLNNVGTPATDTDPASPGYLIVQFETQVSGPPDPVNGHMVLQNVVVQGGVLQVNGANFDSQNMVLPEEKQASVDGVNATLSNVVIDVNQGILRDKVAGAVFMIVPAVGSTAEVLDSTVLADNGGIVILSNSGAPQSWDLAGSTLLARNAGSQIQLFNPVLIGGTLSTENGGQIVISDTARFEHVRSNATLSVPQGRLLTLASTFYGVNGSLGVDGTLTLDGTVPIGGEPFIDSGADYLGGNLSINATGKLTVLDEVRILGANVTNQGTIQLDSGQSLEIGHSTDNTTLAPSFLNAGHINVNEAFLTVDNPTFSNAGVIDIEGGTITAPTYEQTGGSTKINGQLAADANLKGGIFSGSGIITGALTQTGGDLEPGNSPGTLTVGSYTLSSGLLHDRNRFPHRFRPHRRHRRERFPLRPRRHRSRSFRSFSLRLALRSPHHRIRHL